MTSPDDLRDAVALLVNEAIVSYCSGDGLTRTERVKTCTDQILSLFTPNPDLGEGWLPIESAPKGADVLVYWPRMTLDEDGELTWVIVDAPGHIGTSRNDFGGWEPDNVVEANGDWFGDDFEFAEPTHWRPLPAPPLGGGGEGGVPTCPCVIGYEGRVYTAQDLWNLLDGRDAWLASRGLFGEFTDSLPTNSLSILEIPTPEGGA